MGKVARRLAELQHRRIQNAVSLAINEAARNGIAKLDIPEQARYELQSLIADFVLLDPVLRLGERLAAAERLVEEVRDALPDLDGEVKQ